MNKEHFKGTWNILKGRLKQAYAGFMDDDLRYAKGRLDKQVGIVQWRLGQQREEIRREINALRN